MPEKPKKDKDPKAGAEAGDEGNPPEDVDPEMLRFHTEVETWKAKLKLHVSKIVLGLSNERFSSM